MTIKRARSRAKISVQLSFDLPSWRWLGDAAPLPCLHAVDESVILLVVDILFPSSRVLGLVCIVSLPHFPHFCRLCLLLSLFNLSICLLQSLCQDFLSLNNLSHPLVCGLRPRILNCEDS